MEFFVIFAGHPDKLNNRFVEIVESYNLNLKLNI